MAEWSDWLGATATVSIPPPPPTPSPLSSLSLLTFFSFSPLSFSVNTLLYLKEIPFFINIKRFCFLAQTGRFYQKQEVIHLPWFDLLSKGRPTFESFIWQTSGRDTNEYCQGQGQISSQRTLFVSLFFLSFVYMKGISFINTCHMAVSMVRSNCSGQKTFHKSD